MPSLEELRKRKMEELISLQQDRMQQQTQEQAQLQQQIARLEAVVKQYLTKDALVRYGSLKSAHAEKAIQALVIISQFIQAGKISGKIGDADFKKLLEQMTPKKREIKISK